ncbi:MAG: hypothetical protein KDC38_01150 [Planctomycetes bacterium]|nr:hypothetical protein [Planctomycetota bacterium]
MIQRVEDLEDQVFSFYGESQDIDFVRDRCFADPRVRDQLEPGVFARMRTLENASAEVLSRSLQLESLPVARSLTLFFWTYWQQRQLMVDATPLEPLRFGAHPVDDLYLRLILSASRSDGARRAIREVIAELEAYDSVKARLVSICALYWSSGIDMQREEFELARASLDEAWRICRRHRFIASLNIQWRLGSLRWQLGDYAGALRLHRDEGARVIGRRFGKFSWLLQSHSSACKCALDANELDIARQEIGLAAQLIHDNGLYLNPVAVGNFLHFRGEYYWAIGEVDEACHWIREALRYFKDAHEVRGTVEANVTLSRVVVRNRPTDHWDREVLGARLRGLSHAAASAKYHDLKRQLVQLQQQLAAS